jgi:hypothetical protein
MSVQRLVAASKFRRLSVGDGHKRDVYVGAQAKLLVLIASVAPRVVDRVMSNYRLIAANPATHDVTRLAAPLARSALRRRRPGRDRNRG